MRSGDMREVQSVQEVRGGGVAGVVGVRGVAVWAGVTVAAEENMAATSLLLDGTFLKYRELIRYSIDIVVFVY